jgi:hypothetical protein
MLKTALLAVTAALLASSAALAHDRTVNYTLGDGVGTPLCDGFTLAEDSGVAVGSHTAGTACTEGDYAGGFSGKKVVGSTDTQWLITTTDTNNFAGYTEVFVLDQTAMTWQLYVESTQNSATFALYDSGLLLDGTPSQNGQVAQKNGGKPRLSSQKQ